MENFDVVVIGGGPGGYPAAIRAAQLGASVALVEKEALGGTCLNWGCIPTKTLIASSDLFARIGHAAELGIKADKIGYDYGAMSKRKDEVVAKLRGGVGMLLKGNGVKVFTGTASFVSRNRLSVQGEGGETILEAKNTIIATGAVSAVPGFLPKHERVIESRKFLERTGLPASLIILGGGVIGCEFACMAAQLGVKVTVVEMLEDVLMILDADVRRELRGHMEKKLGIRVLTGKPLEKIEAGAKSVKGKFGDETVEGDLLLVAIGRRPYTEGLGLEKIGIEKNKAGFIDVDDYGQTKAATVYAIGDVNGRTQLAHAATSQGVTAAENAITGKRKKMESLIPACIFTSPEIGSVGMTEQQAKEKGIEYKTGKFMFGGLGKAMAMGETGGFIKWIAKAGTDQLLGAHAVGPHATELISEAVVAIRAELTVQELGRTVHCHPTLSESWMEAAHAVHGECIHAAPRRK
ncbi:MAG: dihydrolipoyl dehydrogenase [Verrucomicrobia bacterium]|nr:dihydrolipoyl dehydrogenase [Verrucomicrobiota bacterium]